MGVVIAPLGDPLTGDIVLLAEAARQEGYNHILRIAEEWSSGTNRFERHGESLLGALDQGLLIAVGGMTLEPSRADWLRMRRFYVSQPYRGKGVGRHLAERLIERARSFTPVVTVHAGSDDARRFWQAMGFQPLTGESYTHTLRLI
ncbi:GNAT superfamily N-acetyltransferase [Neorhizobium galegae]|uniref:GNAT family N-acetyltransferase n=1 Tax=Neorhizobium galegae TaxID=399 RepID=UPI001AE0FDBA|nr:GNAT family N-acetyltransferase [Neorhizobium galegae]MBP2562816.1 GNAT superfamily N-acetyltransferase [Neorhizobium galegae]